MHSSRYLNNRSTDLFEIGKFIKKLVYVRKIQIPKIIKQFWWLICFKPQQKTHTEKTPTFFKCNFFCWPEPPLKM